LGYTQLQVNTVIIGAELALYLPVPLFGYLCDRIGPAPLSFISALLFGVAYVLAAFTYKSGAKDISGYTHERGWPLWVMVLAFVVVGMGTTCMYISAVTTCAKNFGRGKYRGLALAAPIAAFGLSGMWLSQVGEKALYERLPGGKKGDVDVFKFFLFLAITLLAVGLLGTFLLKVVDEEELIDEAVEELERSGLLEDSEFFRRANGGGRYGSVDERLDDEGEEARRVDEAKALEEEEARKKTWLLNEETRRFVKDHTMWSLASGFFFISGMLSVARRNDSQLTMHRSWRGFYNKYRHNHQDFIPADHESYRHSDVCCDSRIHHCNHIDHCSTRVRHFNRYLGSTLRWSPLPIRKQFSGIAATPR
jgi:MFS family permease